MSGGYRVSLNVPGATAADLLALAPRADHWNVACLWIGDPRGSSANSDDSYVTAAAAAVAAVTEDIRIGLVLALRDERQVVRVAEDVAVIDQASHGRVELALHESGEGWLERAGRFLRAWNAWQLPGRDETVAVIPGPLQSALPRVVIGSASAAATLGAGRMLLGPEPAPHDVVPARRILLGSEQLDRDGVRPWLESGAHARCIALREEVEASGAQELLLTAASPLAEDDLSALGTVVIPSLRASGRDVRAISTDAWTWLMRKQHLHAPPT